MFLPRLLVLLITAATSVVRAEDLWEPVRRSAYGNFNLKVQDANLSTKQRMAILKLIRSTSSQICEADDATAPWTGNVHFSSITLAPTVRAVLVGAGRGCARSGQGANGAMWLVRFDHGVPVLLAGPHTGFDGFLYALGRARGTRYRDLIVGWHMSGTEDGLRCFRFDGRAYRAIASAVLRRDVKTNAITLADK